MGEERTTNEQQKSTIKKLFGFPGGAVVENLPANAGDMWGPPGPGGSHMLCSNWAPVPPLPKSECLEPVLRNEEWPLLAATRGSPSAATKTQCNQK